MRCTQELTVQIIRPRVIGAENHPIRDAALHGAPDCRVAFTGRRTETGTPMTAHVVERTQRALLIADEDDALATHVDHPMIAGARQLLLAPDTHPFAKENVFLFQRVHVFALVPECRQCRFETGQSGIRGHHEAPRRAHPARRGKNKFPDAQRRRISRRPRSDGNVPEMITRLAGGVGALLLSVSALARPLTADDLYRLQTVSDPRISPDGLWVAYTVTTPRREGDKDDQDIWLVRWK